MGAESQHLCSLPLMPSLTIRQAHTHNQAVLLLGPVQQQGVTAAQAVITACAPARATWSAVHAPGRPCHAVSTCMAAALPLQSDVSAGTILETQRRSKVPSAALGAQPLHTHVQAASSCLQSLGQSCSMGTPSPLAFTHSGTRIIPTVL